MKNFLKNYTSPNIYGKCSDREDETSLFKMCSWNSDAAGAMVTNCRFLSTLHDSSQVGHFLLLNFTPIMNKKSIELQKTIELKLIIQLGLRQG